MPQHAHAFINESAHALLLRLKQFWVPYHTAGSAGLHTAEWNRKIYHTRKTIIGYFRKRYYFGIHRGLLQISLKARPASEESSQFSAADQNPLQRQELSRSKTRPPLNQASQTTGADIHIARLLATKRQRCRFCGEDYCYCSWRLVSPSAHA